MRHLWIKLLFVVCVLATLSLIAATLYRNGNVDVSGTDYGLMPTNAPNIGDVLTVTANGTAWTSLTNFIRVWSGTTGGLLLGIGTTTYLPPNNTSSNLITVEAAGATRCPLTRATTLQNLYVVATPAPGSGKTNTITILTNGVATSIVASIIGTATNANDTTHSVTVTAGTEVGIRIVTAASSTAQKLSWSFEGR